VKSGASFHISLLTALAHFLPRFSPIFHRSSASQVSQNIQDVWLLPHPHQHAANARCTAQGTHGRLTGLFMLLLGKKIKLPAGFETIDQS
jgi:hypothetical protein